MPAPGHASAHNLNYWQFGDYLGIGAGAHGKLSSHEGIIRETRPKHPKAQDASDPLHAARAAEVTSLWRLGKKKPA